MPVRAGEWGFFFFFFYYDKGRLVLYGSLNQRGVSTDSDCANPILTRPTLECAGINNGVNLALPIQERTVKFRV